MKTFVVRTEIDGRDRRVEVLADGIGISGGSKCVLERTDVPDVWNWVNGSETTPVHVQSDGMSGVTITVRGYSYSTSILIDRHHDLLDILNASPSQRQRVTRIAAPMPGLLKAVLTGEGAHVKKGDTLFTLEAMKMENAIKTPVAGVVRELTAKEGIAFEKGILLCVVEPNASL
ncbi:MAG: biotin/lipoyl-binding protein [Candidatus Kapabacteria bacterium]|nr:biotin/lipoyl-binding protein [Candidatus Kapabacteria bacterium]